MDYSKCRGNSNICPLPGMQSRAIRKLLPCRKRAILYRGMELFKWRLACTQVKCSWLPPTYVNEVPCAELDDKNGVASSTNSTGKAMTSASNVIPTETEMNVLFLKFNVSKKKPVILSLMPSYADQFVLKSRLVPTLPALYDHENLQLNCTELLEKHCKIDVFLILI